MEKLWTTSEVAKCLGIGETDVDQLVRDGKLTGYKLGGQFLRFRPDEVKQLKAHVTPRPEGAVATALEPRRGLERVRDFFYFYDFYLLSFVLLIGLILYVMSSG
jgi:excisionase family DNA binding protein